VEKVETHQQAKFRQNRLISCEDIKIFPFFNMAAVAILHFCNSEIILADGVWRAQTHNCTKFPQNQSFCCGDFVIFRILKMSAAAILYFEILKVYWLLGWRGSRRISMSNFVKIYHSVVKILRFFDFSSWRLPPSWIFKFVKCYWLTVSEGPNCITVPNFVKIGQ